MVTLESKNTNQIKKRIIRIFTRVSYKLTFSNKKNNQLLLCLDLLKDNAKINLLFIINKNIEKTFIDLYQQPNSCILMERKREEIYRLD